MKLNYVAAAAVILSVAGCQSLFSRPTQYELEPITVSGTTYEIYERVQSEHPELGDPRNDPEALHAVYARVGPSATVYCGTTTSGCEAAIRRFNQRQGSGGDMY